jgi:hypothetical protein
MGTTMTPEPEVRAISYVVTAAPDWSHPDRSLWDIEVHERGGGKWGVYNRTRCLGSDGEWSWESIPSERRDEWLAEHRFDLDTALRLAKEQAPHVTVNGLTVEQARALWSVSP